MINERTVERGSKKTKGGIVMKRLVILLMAVGLVGLMAGTGEAATEPARIDLYITPIVLTSLTVSPTFYNFGSVNVDMSTGSTSALTMTNDGDIDITIEKEMFADGAAWDITKSSSVEDGFLLWAMVAAVGPPSHAAFVTGISSFSEVALDTLNFLTDTAGAQIEMSKDETRNLWFRLDMPYAVSTVAEQKIQIRLKATSN